MSEPTIHRVSFENHFTITANSTHEDEYLSWAAKGLLGYLISRPADWKIHRSHLAKIYKGSSRGNGTDAIDSMFDELIERGYIIYTKQDPETGKYVHRYDVYPVPYKVFKINYPHLAEPPVVKPPLVSPPPIQSNDLEQRKNNKQAEEVVVNSDLEENIQLIKQSIPSFNPSQAMSLAKKTKGSDLRQALSMLKEAKNVRNPIGWLSHCISEKLWENPDNVSSLKDTLLASLRDLYGKNSDKMTVTTGDDWIEVHIKGRPPMMIEDEHLKNEEVLMNICDAINKYLVSPLKLVRVTLLGKNEFQLL